MEPDYFLNFLHRLSTEKRITPKIGRHIAVLNSLCLKVSAGFNYFISGLYKTIKNVIEDLIYAHTGEEGMKLQEVDLFLSRLLVQTNSNITVSSYIFLIIISCEDICFGDKSMICYLYHIIQRFTPFPKLIS